MDVEKGDFTKPTATDIVGAPPCAGGYGGACRSNSRWGKYAMGYKSIRSRNAAFSVLSVNALLCLLAVNSIASFGCAQGVLSLFSINSILSIGSLNSILAVGCTNEILKICVERPFF